jgi:hypothetical protein
MENVVSFNSEKVAKYLNDVFNGYTMDFATSPYQAGFLAACLVIHEEALGKKFDEKLTRLSDKLSEFMRAFDGPEEADFPFDH